MITKAGIKMKSFLFIIIIFTLAGCDPMLNVRLQIKNNSNKDITAKYSDYDSDSTIVIPAGTTKLINSITVIGTPHPLHQQELYNRFKEVSIYS